MTILLTEVKSKSDLTKFIHLPWELYKNDQTWVPPLKLAIKDMFSPKHPFYRCGGTIKSWIAYKNSKAVGRISAILNEKHNEFHSEKCGFFGFFESIDDQEVADTLINRAKEYLKSSGMDQIRGPINLSTNYECALLIKGMDDPPQIMMPYNPSYYSKLLEGSGFAKAKDLLAYKIDLDFQMPDKILRVANLIEKRKKVNYRQINLKDWNNEIKLMFEIYNDAWEKNWGFVPMTLEEFKHTAKELKSVIDPRFVFFVLVENREAGFIIALPDFNQVFKQIPNGKLLPTGIFKLLMPKKYLSRVRVLTLGIRKKYQSLGLGSLLYKQTHEELKKSQYVEAEMSWILEDNHQMNSPLIEMGADPYKSYRIYQQSI